MEHRKHEIEPWCFPGLVNFFIPFYTLLLEKNVKCAWDKPQHNAFQIARRASNSLLNYE